MLLSLWTPQLLLAESRPIEFSIAPQPLARALYQYAEQAGVQIFFSPEVLDQYQNPPLVGFYSLEDALKHLLLKTEFQYVIKDNIVVIKVEAEGPDTLKTDASQELSQVPVIDEVLVTARKHLENLQRTPLAISSFSGASLSALGAENITDIAPLTPNVQFVQDAMFSGSSSTSAVLIRGVGQLDFLITADPGVGIYVDGVYLARSTGAVLDLLDIERVEILRGPQGTLFGRNTIGGVVNVISKRPAEKLSGSLSLTLGDDQRHDLYFSVDVPLTEKLLTRFSGLRRKRDGFVDLLQYDGVELGDDDSWATRAVVSYFPTDRLSLDLSLDYTRERETGSPLIPVDIDASKRFGELFNRELSGDETCLTPTGQEHNAACFGPIQLQGVGSYASNALFLNDETDDKVDPESEFTVYGIGFTAGWDVSENLTFKSITAFRELTSSFINDLDGTQFPVFQNTNVKYDQEQFSEELQLLGRAFDRKLSWVAGLYYFREEGEQSVALRGSTFLVPPDLRTIDNESLAAFVQGTYDFSNGLHFSAGVRYTRDDKAFQQRAFDEFGVQLVVSERERLQNSQVTSLLTLAYDLADDVMAYVSYSEGFKSGGFSSRVTRPLTSLPQFGPEYVDVYEVGLKATLLNSRARFNVAAFYTDYSDIQLTVGDDNLGISRIANIGEANLQGLEIELDAVISKAVTANLALGVLKADYDSVMAGSMIPVESELPYAPEATLSAGLAWEENLSSGASLGFRLNWAYTTDIMLNTENSVEQDAYGLMSASLTYRPQRGNWLATLGVKNLTNEEYWISGAESGVVGAELVSLGRPRHVYATLKYRL